MNSNVEKGGKNFSANHSALTLRVNLGFFSFSLKSFPRNVVYRVGKKIYDVFSVFRELCFNSNGLIYLCAIVTPGRRAP